MAMTTSNSLSISRRQPPQNSSTRASAQMLSEKSSRHRIDGKKKFTTDSQRLTD
jgi:hypothetical protein